MTFVKAIKRYLKFVLSKDYRTTLFKLETAGEIRSIKQPEIAENSINCRKYLILRRENVQVGTFSDYIVFLREIELAIEKGYVPIVDRKTIKNVFLPSTENINSWEIFFEQPFGVGMEVLGMKETEVYLKVIPNRIDPISLLHCSDKIIVDYWRSIAKKYIRFNEETYQKIMKIQRNYDFKKNVMGVSVREGYMKLFETEPERIKDHPKQASMSDLLNIVEKYLNEWQCDQIFFSCQTTDTVDLFKQRFGDNAFCIERNRKSYSELLDGSQININSEDEGYNNELAYITEMFLLSKCSAFLCSGNSGSDAVLLLSDGFEHYACIENGLY